MISTPAAVTGRGLAKDIAKRFGLAILALIVVTVVLGLLAGLPPEAVGPISSGVAATIFFAGAFPRGTPRHGFKNAVLWGAHFALFTGGLLVISHLRGA